MKEAFSSEKEKITCKGAMEVVDTQLYERCNIAQYYTVNDVIPVPSFLSSQCVTLGSSFSYNLVKNVCFSIRRLFLCLDPSVSYSDDRKKGYWDDTFQVSQITMFVQLCVSYLDYRRVLVDDLGEL